MYTNERSSSALKRLKTYLRSTMLQKRLNLIAILHIYAEMVDNLDIDLLLNEFIGKNSKRAATFAVPKKKN